MVSDNTNRPPRGLFAITAVGGTSTPATLRRPCGSTSKELVLRRNVTNHDPHSLSFEGRRAGAMRIASLLIESRSSSPHHHHPFREVIALSTQSTGARRPPNGCISHCRRGRSTLQAHMEGVSREPVSGREHGQEHSGLQQPGDEVRTLLMNPVCAAFACNISLCYPNPVPASSTCLRPESPVHLKDALSAGGALCVGIIISQPFASTKPCPFLYRTFSWTTTRQPCCFTTYLRVETHPSLFRKQIERRGGWVKITEAQTPSHANERKASTTFTVGG